MPSPCMMAGSCRKHSRSNPSSGKGPRSNLVEGCLAAWSSSNVSGSRKVTHQGGQGRLHVGDQAGLSCPGGALKHLWHCPLDSLYSQSWLWEQKWASSLVWVTDILNHSIHSSIVVVATRACHWASLALASHLFCLMCPMFLTGRLYPSGRMAKCWGVLVLHFPQAVYLCSTVGIHLEKPRCLS